MQVYDVFLQVLVLKEIDHAADGKVDAFTRIQIWSQASYDEMVR